MHCTCAFGIIKPIELCGELMARGISGETSAGEYTDDACISDAATGKTEYHRTPGV